jgi:hypothetical protein
MFSAAVDTNDALGSSASVGKAPEPVQRIYPDPAPPSPTGPPPVSNSAPAVEPAVEPASPRVANAFAVPVPVTGSPQKLTRLLAELEDLFNEGKLDWKEMDAAKSRLCGARDKTGKMQEILEIVQYHTIGRFTKENRDAAMFECLEMTRE